ncbi:hypothetical protein AMECASPLE_002928 [Ameca splendens]|uniref:Uncharacterized protein n=1 Tax=Ameca splendens TaxID=208324 RepID=A0ABV0YA32_9TELE
MNVWRSSGESQVLLPRTKEKPEQLLKSDIKQQNVPATFNLILKILTPIAPLIEPIKGTAPTGPSVWVRKHHHEEFLVVSINPHFYDNKNMTKITSMKTTHRNPLSNYQGVYVYI